MSEILESLFGSRERARLLRFFLQNPEPAFSFSEIVSKNMLNAGKTRNELTGLANIKFILKRVKGGKTFYQLNQEFNFYPELKNLIAKSNIYPQCQSLSKTAKIGNIKLAVISGVFINYAKSIYYRCQTRPKRSR